MAIIHDKKEVERLFEEFAQKNRSKYSKRAWEYIEKNFWLEMPEKINPDILMQIYTELGIEVPFYQDHLKKLQKNFDIDCNILEVGSGYIPSFANLLAHEQLKIGKGTITLYEPILINTKPKYHNMTLHKENFTSETHIKEFDLITAIMPCDVTELVLEQACKNQKDFYIAMCGCTHFEYIPWGIPANSKTYKKQLIEKTSDLLKKYDNGELVVELLDDSYYIDYPILYNRKK